MNLVSAQKLANLQLKNLLKPLLDTFSQWR